MRNNKMWFNEPAESKPLSLSEKIALAVEAEDSYQASVQDLSDSEQALEIANSLEDLHVVLKCVDAKTPTLISLVKAFANSAVIGGDVSPENVVPCLESIDGAASSDLTQSLPARVDAILNSYLQCITHSFELLVKHLNSVLMLVKEIFSSIDELKSRYYKLSNLPDDTERSVQFSKEDRRYMITPIGAACTLGDLFNSLKRSEKSFAEFTDVAFVVNKKLVAGIKQFSCLDASTNSQSLFDCISNTWQNDISKSGLITATAQGSCQAYETLPMLGGDKIGFSLNCADPTLSSEASTDGQLEVIRSFALSVSNTVASAGDEALTLSGLTNKGVNLLIEEMRKLAVDLERHVNGCLAAANSVVSEGNANKAMLDQTKMSRQDLQNSVASISSVIKVINAIACVPTNYARDLLIDLVIVASKGLSD